MTQRKQWFDSREWQRADDAFWALDPNADDATIAEVVAERCVAGHSPPYYLFIIHDIKPITLRHIARMEKHWPGYRHSDPVGPCPLRYDWQRKNIVGIKEPNREIAKQWAIDALLLGYAVFETWKITCNGAGRGALAEVRKDVQERREWNERTKQRREMVAQDEPAT
jgi:hypothetical protein